MTTTSQRGTTATEVRRRGVETTGIEIIDEKERTARPHDLFWPWFAAHVSVFGISYGAYVLGIYSSGLTLLSLGVRSPRPAAALVDGIILTAGTICVVFFAQSFLGPFQSFLITLGVPLAAWAGVMIADIALRRCDYDEDALFDARGRYGSVDWISLALLAVASVVGWGLVVNTFAADAAWNNWQGYLLQPLGLGTRTAEGWDGAWPYSNIGVLLALLIGLTGGIVLRRRRVRRQEAGDAR